MDRGKWKDLEKMESLKVISLIITVFKKINCPTQRCAIEDSSFSSTKGNVFKLLLSEIIS